MATVNEAASIATWFSEAAARSRWIIATFDSPICASGRSEFHHPWPP
jgi:hypothetical protein